MVAQDQRIGAVKFTGRSRLDRLERQPHGLRGNLRVAPFSDLRLVARIPKHRDPRRPRYDLLQQLDALAGHVRGESAHTGDVAAGARETGDETAPHWIGADCHDDGDFVGGLPRGANWCLATGDDYIDSLAHKLDGLQ
jgi:hypothetical protein